MRIYIATVKNSFSLWKPMKVLGAGDVFNVKPQFSSQDIQQYLRKNNRKVYAKRNIFWHMNFN